MRNKNLFRQIKISLILLSVLFSICLYSTSTNQAEYSIKNKPNDYFSLDHLNPAANEINIETPENKTYIEPMSGYYPATYGFENDDDGSDPIGWAVEEPGSEDVEILEELDGHKKVLELFDTTEGISSQAKAYDGFSAQTSGTVEWWFRRDGYQEYIYMRFWEDFSSTALLLSSASGNFQYNDGSWHNFATCEDDTWYHMQVDFECGAGSYQGLSADTFYVYIDGTRYGPYSFYNSTDDVDTLEFITRGWGTSSDYWGYFDAIGYSWDPNYEIGDNLNEGLLLSYSNSTNLDWIGYSFDGQGNKTILGNTTIPLPEDGYHNIQVFGNDSSGRSYNSEIQYFSMDILGPSITINSPFQNQYFSSMAPNYNVSIIDWKLQSMWYTIDNGLTNISFTGLTGTLDQTEWDKITDGLLTVRFYANDTLGISNYIEINIYKDTTDPIITINSPLNSEEFYELPPEFNLTVDELNLDSIWYTIDGGLTNITITEMTGFIDSTAWNEAPIGAVSLRFYARDIPGNEIYQEIVVLKRASEVQPGIPGFNLPILFIMLGLITIASIKIKKNKIN